MPSTLIELKEKGREWRERKKDKGRERGMGTTVQRQSEHRLGGCCGSGRVRGGEQTD